MKSKIETEEYFSNQNNTPLTKTLICKFDLDADGKISFEDLRGILQRYANTSFFKYENSLNRKPLVEYYLNFESVNFMYVQAFDDSLILLGEVFFSIYIL